ncbi:MAG: YqaJ viral recombinase family protein [Bacteroidaceae bacterium]|nr:YqaJ viral recombinase family protein [Bacteroidaceae bacterium]
MYDVTVDRDRYIGGSDIPIIMGISTFNTRWGLLQEKAGLKENTFTGNRYTEYGNILEPQIREHINGKRKKRFAPEQVIVDDLRGNTDGFNGDTVLEIKTTSHVFDTVDEYKVYLVQLLFYMQLYGVKKGKLAVYSRPDDFSPVFDAERLKIYDITLNQYTDLLAEINAEIARFRDDLERLRNNPLLTEQDFQPTELVAISKSVLMLEQRMAEFKTIEAEHKRMKQALFDAMERYGVKSWETPNGAKITRVDAVPASVKVVTEFDEAAFKAENPALYAMYQHDVEKRTAGKNGYVRVTLCTN